MTKKLTVASLAERLARASGQSPAFHARQIRHWAQHGIFWDAFLPADAGPTTSREFEEKHIGRALLLSVLSAQDFDVDHLKTIAGSIMTILDAEDRARLYPIGTSYPASDTGLIAAIEATKRGESGWFLEIYRAKDGKIGVGAGGFTTKPDISPILASLFPLVTVLNVSAFLPFMFEDAE